MQSVNSQAQNADGQRNGAPTVTQLQQALAELETAACTAKGFLEIEGFVISSLLRNVVEPELGEEVEKVVEAGLYLSQQAGGDVGWKVDKWRDFLFGSERKPAGPGWEINQNGLNILLSLCRLLSAVCFHEEAARFRQSLDLIAARLQAAFDQAVELTADFQSDPKAAV